MRVGTLVKWLCAEDFHLRERGSNPVLMWWEELGA